MSLPALSESATQARRRLADCLATNAIAGSGNPDVSDARATALARCEPERFRWQTECQAAGQTEAVCEHQVLELENAAEFMFR